MQMPARKRCEPLENGTIQTNGEHHSEKRVYR
jgi:hypothetical protein